ncbi:Anaerobic nitric oxide reductase transcription regulator NorR [bioreactor metagenome]|uniref:Anaerobic nitric oxide reductase transcription regulator NorR n=1 Tax=bioreactor metagenome TaxID=1076179 RepID=A0A645FF27_9ZZZZ
MRFIAATNRNLAEEIKKGNFRADLYYRLNVLPVRTLSLRERKTDILVLSNYFLKRYSVGKYNSIYEVLENDAVQVLIDYDWPGNIRQLENAVEYIISTAKNGEKIDKTRLPEYITDNQTRLGESVLKEVLGNNMIWILAKMKNSDGVGRRYLASLAKEEGLPLTEGQIRSLLNSAELLGLVEISTGRKGTVLTEKGDSILSSIVVNG